MTRERSTRLARVYQALYDDGCPAAFVVNYERDQGAEVSCLEDMTDDRLDFWIHIFERRQALDQQEVCA